MDLDDKNIEPLIGELKTESSGGNKGKMEPLWSKEDNVHFLTRTETQYASMPISELADRNLCQNRLLENLLEFLPDGCVIAGGFATSMMMDEKQASDIDIFCLSKKAFIEIYNLLTESSETLKKEGIWAYEGYKTETELSAVSKDMRFIKFTHEKRLPIQILKMAWYDSPEHIIDSFDLTISQFAFTNERFYYNPIAVFDLTSKKLVLHRMQFPSSTLRRIVKYSKKGFYACPGSLRNIVESTLKFAQDHPDVDDFARNVVYVD